MKLIDVARASLSETIDDLSFVCLRQGQPVWGYDDPRICGVRQIKLDRPHYSTDILHDATEHVLNQKKKFDPWLLSDDMLIRANALIILCTRVISMLRGQLQQSLEDFKLNGGFTENMSQARLEAKNQQNQAEGAPRCQKCGMPMTRRTIRKGERAGRQFWGCPNYFITGCDFTIEIK